MHSTGLTRPMADADHGVNVAAGVEIGFKLHPDRIGGRHQVIQDAVGYLFMGDGLVAIAVHVKLDRLELDHPWARLVDQAQNSEIRVARERAFASELRQLDRHLIRSAWARVVEADQLGFGDSTLAVERCLGLLSGHRVSHSALTRIIRS